MLTARNVSHGECHRCNHSPEEDAADRCSQGIIIACTIELSAQCLACIGKAIHDITHEKIQLHEQCVHGQHHLALPRACACEEHHDTHHAQCAEEYVAVDAEEGFVGDGGGLMVEG